MIGLPATVRVFVAVEPADLRKGYDGLARLARDVMSKAVNWPSTSVPATPKHLPPSG